MNPWKCGTWPTSSGQFDESGRKYTSGQGEGSGSRVFGPVGKLNKNAIGGPVVVVLCVDYF